MLGSGSLRVDTAGPTPPYEQIKSQLIARIESGELAPGAQLPTVRGLAADLGLAPNTVARTYRELEAEGYVLTQGRRGTVVAGAAEAGADARRAAEDFARRVRDLGLTTADALRLARTALEQTEAGEVEL